mmetsp:Transcript_35428/g.80911  ORF Transcript_35428/g.80911 Transcript_35428/m.80911 type:complete len:255 (+) Transcript_35428:381-1145(+)
MSTKKGGEDYNAKGRVDALGNLPESHDDRGYQHLAQEFHHFVVEGSLHVVLVKEVQSSPPFLLHEKLSDGVGFRRSLHCVLMAVLDHVHLADFVLRLDHVLTFLSPCAEHLELSHEKGGATHREPKGVGGRHNHGKGNVHVPFICVALDGEVRGEERTGESEHCLAIEQRENALRHNRVHEDQDKKSPLEHPVSDCQNSGVETRGSVRAALGTVDHPQRPCSVDPKHDQAEDKRKGKHEAKVVVRRVLKVEHAG